MASTLETGLVAVDIVTTNRDPLESELLELEAVAIGKDGPGERFHALCKPAKALGLRVEKATGIKNSDLAGKGSAKKALKAFMSFLGGRAMVVHGGQEELSVISFLAKGDVPREVFDSADLARIVAPTALSFELNVLAHRLDVKYDGPQGIATRAGLIAALWARLVGETEALSPPVITALVDLLKGETHPLKVVFAAAMQKIAAKSFGGRRGEWRDVFPDMSKLSVDRPEALPEEAEATPLDVEAVTAIFEDGGLFSKHMAFYERRAEQIEMVTAVCRALNEGTHLMIEAGTGTGKSLAYLAPVIQWAKQNNQRVIVSTNTKNLQAQIYFKDLPFLLETLPVACKTAIIKGRRNYLCVRKFLYVLREHERELESDERIAMLPVVTWAATTDTGDIAGNTSFGYAGGADLWEKLSSDGAECAGRGCREFRHCFVRRARALSLAADLVVANHAVVFAELGLEQGAVLPPYSVIVFDEAHNLENVATECFSKWLYPWRIYRILNRLHRARRDGSGKGLFTNIRFQLARSGAEGTAEGRAADDRIQKMIGLFSEISRAVESFFGACAPLYNSQGGAEGKIRFAAESQTTETWDDIAKEKRSLVAQVSALAKSLETLMELLKALADRVEYGRDFQREIQYHADSLKEVVSDIEFVCAGSEANHVYWTERVSRRHVHYELRAAPLEIAVMMQQYFYDPKRSVIMSSATMSVDGRFDFMRERLGAADLPPERLTCKDVGSSFDFEKQTRLYVPTCLPEPRETKGAFEEELTRLLTEMLRASGGRGMVLFTSYEMLNAVYPGLKENLEPENILVLGQGKDGSRDAVAALFQRDITSVLLGTQSFWEGVDFAGETLSLLVIAKLPFHVFTEPIIQARCELLSSRGLSPFLHYTLPSAVIRLKQGFGRLIRTKSDRGIVVIADRRLVQKRYGQAFLRSLPRKAQVFERQQELLDALKGFFEGGG